ncbi:Nuclear SAM-dependent mono-and asymmetric methyltransferase [Mitosporidium daphniae]
MSSSHKSRSEGADGSSTGLDYYFDSYSHFGIHEEMLKDRVRTLSYKDAICSNRHLFKDKVVLDIGCGTAILSMFAVKAGARLVIGVDMSDMIDHAREIVAINGFSDRKMEEVELPVQKVDIIISEWMGYFLLYENMFDTVLWARDRYLDPVHGLMLPDSANMYLLGIEDAQYKDEKIHFWEDVYGFNMSPIKKLALQEPLVDTVEPNAIVTEPFLFCSLNLMTLKKEDLSFKVPFSLLTTKNDYLHAFLSYFDVTFSACHKPISFSTGPRDKYTHWKQTIFYLKKVLLVSKGETINGTISVAPNAVNCRNLDIEIEYAHESAKTGTTSKEHLFFSMS